MTETGRDAAMLEAIEGVMELMGEAGRFPDEREPDAIYPHGNGYGLYFLSQETVDIGLTTPMKAEEILPLVKARIARRAERRKVYRSLHTQASDEGEA